MGETAQPTVVLVFSEVHADSPSWRLLQLIDPYWTLAPPLILQFYRASLLHSTWGTARQITATVLLWAWSIRLTYSYFRRCNFRSS